MKADKPSKISGSLTQPNYHQELEMEDKTSPNASLFFNVKYLGIVEFR
jgi:hypothetical protein